MILALLRTALLRRPSLDVPRSHIREWILHLEVDSVVGDDDINDMPFTTPLSGQIAEWLTAHHICHQKSNSGDLNSIQL